MRIWYWITVATGLLACSEEDKTSTVSPTAASSTSTATQATESPTPKPVSAAELEQRRAQAVKQTNALRDSINQVAGIMPMESSEGPIPSQIPGTTGLQAPAGEGAHTRSLRWSSQKTRPTLR